MSETKNSFDRPKYTGHSWGKKTSKLENRWVLQLKKKEKEEREKYSEEYKSCETVTNNLKYVN